MKPIIERYLPVLPFITFVMMTIQVLTLWFFVGWVHYDCQNSVLPKNSYRANLITAEDYAKLQDRSLDKVKLSDGSSVAGRQPVYYETVLPNYKKVGDHYLLVTTVGTAHYYRRWITDTIPLLLLAVCGIFITQWNLRRQYAKTSDPDSNQ